MHLKYAAAAVAASNAVNRVSGIRPGPIPPKPARGDVTKVDIGIEEGKDSYFLYTPLVTHINHTHDPITHTRPQELRDVCAM